MRTGKRVGAVVGVVLAMSLLTACGPPGSAEQGTFSDRARRLEAPFGFEVRDAPLPICPTITDGCGDPTVIATWAPVSSDPTATEVCQSYLAWAGDIGVTSIFIGTGADWPGWFERDEHALIITGAIDTIPLATPDADELCIAIVQRLLDLPPDSSRDDVYEIIGIGGVSGVAGGLTVTRIMPPRTVPDGNPDREGDRIMIATVYVLI